MLRRRTQTRRRRVRPALPCALSLVELRIQKRRISKQVSKIRNRTRAKEERGTSCEGRAFCRAICSILALTGNQNGITPTSHLRSSNNLITDSEHHDAEEEPPTFVASFKYFFLGSWFNVLLIFIPLSFVSHFLNWDAALRFAFSFMAIVPLAKVSTFFKVC